MYENLRIAKDMKYEALYWALGYWELTKNIFSKSYSSNLTIKVDVDQQIVHFPNEIKLIGNDIFKLDNPKSFVVFECIDKLLSMGYSANEIIIFTNKEFDIQCTNLLIKCYEWDKLSNDNFIEPRNDELAICYESRLMSGVIQRKYWITNKEHEIFNYGIFQNEIKRAKYHLQKITKHIVGDFEIEAGVVTKYFGNQKIVTIPNEVNELSPSLFWDNQRIEEVILPQSLINLSGDTFYNACHLKRITIPKNVKYMGNNPFGGCKLLELKNESPYFHYENGALYNNDYSKLIYYCIKNPSKEFVISDKCKILGKHCFYLCNNLIKITIPSSIIKLENNPFSGCKKLHLDNHSNYYHVDDSIIYDQDYSSVIGCLNSKKTNCLVLKDVARICRNSFWNCKGIKKIILPSSLESIGYNPFVGCSNIEFISNSKNYLVYNHALYTANKTKLVCYPRKFAIGKIKLPNETQTLERGAFSGCDLLTNIDFNHIDIISKTCFTNCNGLTKVYCPSNIKYIGEWAFAHCNKLKEISIAKNCFVDNNAIINTNAVIHRRRK